MKKKLFAILTALYCIFPFASATVSAEEETYALPNGYIVTESGAIMDFSRTVFSGILVETDGTELTDSLVNTTDCYRSLSTYESFTTDFPWGYSETNIIPDGTAYMIYTNTADEATLSAYGRSLMLQNECIKNIYLVDVLSYQEVAVENSIDITVTDVTFVPCEFAATELAEFKLDYSYNGYYKYTLPISIYSEYTEYEMYQFLSKVADTLLRNHGDKISSATINCSHLEGSTDDEFDAASVWDGAGDSNTDGIVDAEDAASLLQTAADAGTGAEITVTAAADVNADGTVSADDAAAVLRYAAAEGSGTPMSWAEVLR